LNRKSAIVLTALAIFVATGILAYPLFNFLPRYVPPAALLVIGGLILLALREHDQM
jgi:hypothetical protein